ncbi:protein adenylyltransferase SelO [Halopseudomonas pelagia]|uniref:protein adenylyltransferase SelO n=1 Tax=Halopseudomonas pelagia TaxID=553151 RepID=UPI0030DAFB7D|tara:strand:+ start:110896 stop:112389 length:1494 start_codon:yes stop_codon:yes gene_type:complete
MTQSRTNSPQFDNSYVLLPEHFYSKQKLAPVKSPALIRINQALAEQLGISVDWLASPSGLQVLAGNEVAPGSLPIAMAYAGHQFGGWNPRLGDGRATLLGEVIGKDGKRYDIQLKGAGRTAYARGGDGRSPLGPVLREYVISEAMAALGVPTSRSLAAVTTGEYVMREGMLPGGILTRVCSSHIRIGTFQFFAGQNDLEAVKILADHVIARHYPQAADAERPYAALLRAVITRQAELIAQWQQLGFIHGVMNTDNMLVSGETIDYGPCAFMDNYHPNTVYSSIDSGGRYAYGNQPGIGQWNLAWLARALLPLIDKNEELAVQEAQQALDDYVPQYQRAYDGVMAGKIGLSQADAGSKELIEELLQLMAAANADYTLTFRRLAELAAPGGYDGDSVAELAEVPDSLCSWVAKWEARLASDSVDARERQQHMLRLNPAYIPRNHLVEEVIRAAVDDHDLAPFHRLVERLAEPCRYDAADARYATPPTPEQVVARTYCGT